MQKNMIANFSNRTINNNLSNIHYLKNISYSNKSILKKSNHRKSFNPNINKIFDNLQIKSISPCVRFKNPSEMSNIKNFQNNIDFNPNNNENINKVDTSKNDSKTNNLINDKDKINILNKDNSITQLNLNTYLKLDVNIQLENYILENKTKNYLDIQNKKKILKSKSNEDIKNKSLRENKPKLFLNGEEYRHNLENFSNLNNKVLPFNN